MKGEWTKNKTNREQSGFIEFIVLVFVALLIMKYIGITISEVVAWFKTFFAWFLSFFGSVLR